MFSPPVSSGVKGPGPGGNMEMYNAYKQGKATLHKFFRVPDRKELKLYQMTNF